VKLVRGHIAAARGVKLVRGRIAAASIGRIAAVL
jgi:hypothetical protein